MSMSKLRQVSLLLVAGCAPNQTQLPPVSNTDAGSRPDAGLVSDAGASDARVDVNLSVDLSTQVDAGALLANGRTVSGTVWFPLSPAPSIETQLYARPRLGALRFSLQRLFETPGVSKAAFVAGLPHALESMTELDFLKRYQQHGGEILFNFMAMPAWLGDSTVNPPALCGGGPNSAQLQWRPPSDFDAYANEVVAPVAAFITKRFGPGQRYELWNEPTSCTWYGTTEQFNALYAALVKGVRQADPTALIGGPSHSESVLSVGTINDPASGKTPFVKRFIEAAASAKLPLDFITLHSYNVNPAQNLGFHEAQLATVRGWLAEFGYSAKTTELINDEWNYSVYEDPSFENVNGSFVGAAYSAASMLAFDQAGYDNQATQAFQDSDGQNGVFAITTNTFASLRAIPRSGLHAFELLGKLDGVRVKSHADNPWVRIAASTGANSTTTIVAALFTPHADLSLDTAVASLLVADPAVATVLAPVAAGLKSYLTGTSTTVPSAISVLLTPSQLAALIASKAVFDHERDLRRAWQVGEGRTDPLTSPGRALTWRLTVTGLKAAPSHVRRARIDSHHALTHDQLLDVHRGLTTASVPLACDAMQTVKTTLGAQPVCTALDAFCASSGKTTTGLGQVADCTLLEVFVVELASSASMQSTQQLLDAAHASSTIQQAFQSGFATAFARYLPLYQAALQSPEVAQFTEDVTGSATFEGHTLTLEVPAEPFSVSAFELEP